MSFFRHPYVLNSVVNEPESETIEYKQQFNNLANCIKAYKKTVCGFSNTKGGTLVFGVADCGTVLGMKFVNVHQIDKIVQQLNAICRHMVPSVEGKTEIYEIASDTYVIALRIPKSDVDVYAEHVFYKRINTSNYEIKQVKLLTEGERNDAINRILNIKNNQQKTIKLLTNENKHIKIENQQLKDEIYRLILSQKCTKEKELSINCFSFIFSFFSK
jgi:hypothetical protein